jgi:hypothetical protein
MTEQVAQQDTSDESVENLSSMFSEAFSGTQAQAEPAAPAAPEPASQPASDFVSPASQPAPTQPAPTLAQEPAAQVDPFQQLTENARRLGIATDGVQSADQLAAAMLRQIEQMQPHVRVAQEIAPYADEFREYVESRNKPTPQSPAQAQQSAIDEWNASEYFANQYGGPVFSDKHRQLVESGQVIKDPESGLWAARPGFEAVVGSDIPELNAAQTHVAKFWQGLTSANPYEKFFNVMQEPLLRQVRQEVEKMITGREQTTQVVSEIQRFENEHKTWLYQTDPMTGQAAPSENGKQFFATIADLKAKGVTDQKAILNIAARIHGLGSVPTQPVAQQPAAPQPSMLPQQPPSPLQALQQQAAATKQSFLESAAQRAGYSPNYTADVTSPTPAAPEVSDQAELDSFFTNAMRRSNAG